MDPTSLAVGMMSGLVGFAYFVYGKKQKKIIPLVAGLIMCVVPYLLDDNLSVVLVCVAAAAVPWFIRL